MPVFESVASCGSIDVSGLGSLYARALQDGGYQPSVVQAYSRSVEHFLRWRAGDDASRQIDELLVRHFIDEHLPVCECSGRNQRGKVTVRPALGHLVEVLRAQGVLRPGPGRPGHVCEELDAFCAYGREVCGLVTSTLISRRMWISLFLMHHFPTGAIEISKLCPKDVGNFFTAQCQRLRPGSAQVVAGAVRSYLRFRAVQNGDQVEALVAAIPVAARWRLAPLPEYLSAADLAKLLAAFDRQRPQSQRDYAIVRCLVDLGLRSCEVAALRLDDLDWKCGTVTIRVGKSHRADMLPLPAATGQAIAEYLRNARPTTDGRAVFVRHRAPLNLPVDVSVIRSVVRQAAARSGLAGQLHGPHLLRHSAATRMLHDGASLKEIADVLRHRSLNTTAAYAKVDIARLAAVAQPWPGGAA